VVKLTPCPLYNFLHILPIGSSIHRYWMKAEMHYTIFYILYILLRFFLNNIAIRYPSCVFHAGVTRRQSHVEPDKRCRLAVKPSRTRRSFFRYCNDGRSDNRLGASVRRRRGDSRPLRGPPRSRWVFGNKRDGAGCSGFLWSLSGCECAYNNLQ